MVPRLVLDDASVYDGECRLPGRRTVVVADGLIREVAQGPVAATPPTAASISSARCVIARRTSSYSTRSCRALPKHCAPRRGRTPAWSATTGARHGGARRDRRPAGGRRRPARGHHGIHASSDVHRAGHHRWPRRDRPTRPVSDLPIRVGVLRRIHAGPPVASFDGASPPIHVKSPPPAVRRAGATHGWGLPCAEEIIR
jgi:hypothetical protein